MVKFVKVIPVEVQEEIKKSNGSKKVCPVCQSKAIPKGVKSCKACKPKGKPPVQKVKKVAVQKPKKGKAPKVKSIFAKHVGKHVVAIGKVIAKPVQWDNQVVIGKIEISINGIPVKGVEDHQNVFGGDIKNKAIKEQFIAVKVGQKVEFEGDIVEYVYGKSNQKGHAGHKNWKVSNVVKFDVV